MNYFSILFLISGFHGSFLALVLITKSFKKINANLFLALLLIIVSAYQLKEFIIIEGHFALFPHLMAAFVPLLYLIGPLYYFYIKNSIVKTVNLSRIDILHLVPSFICFLTILPFYLKSGAEKLSMYHTTYPGDFQLAPNRVIYYGLILVSMFVYCLKSISLINQENKYNDGRTTRSIKLTLVWLKYYTWSFMFFILLFFVAQLIFILTDFYRYYVILTTILASSIMIHFVGYWAIKESKITSFGEGEKERKSGVSKAKVQELKSTILDMLETKKVYLMDGLDARYFCKNLSINSQYLSQMINDEFNCSLTHLINSYRIEEAKRIIKNNNYDHLNFLGIAFEVGFSNKNTFTRAFKRHTGMTPSEFKGK